VSQGGLGVGGFQRQNKRVQSSVWVRRGKPGLWHKVPRCFEQYWLPMSDWRTPKGSQVRRQLVRSTKRQCVVDHSIKNSLSLTKPLARRRQSPRYTKLPRGRPQVAKPDTSRLNGANLCTVRQHGEVLVSRQRRLRKRKCVPLGVTR
jgi:hypothetical protein